MGDLFNNILVRPIATILVGIYQLLSFLHVPNALGFSIIILTIIIRFILYPLISTQLKSSKKLQAVAPHVAKLKIKHKGDSKKLQEETLKLYKEHGINPAAGCLPVLIQLPIIWALYALLQKVVNVNTHSIVSDFNKLVYINSLKLTSAWNTNFFGLPLGTSPSKLFSTVGPLILLVPVATAVFQFFLSKMLISPLPAPTSPSEKKAQEEDFANAFQQQSLIIFPLMIGFFSYTFSIGLSLYWNTFTIFGIIQQYQILGWGGLSDWISKLKPGVKKI